jgi:two-component system chemotaxis response regulator CheB
VRTRDQVAGSIDAVVIGASAGGVEALSVVLPALRASAPPVLIVLHLPAERPSLIVELFEPRCAVAIREAEDKEQLSPGTVYFAPPGYHLLVEPGPQVALSVDAPVNYSRPSIDVLFQSAVEVYGSRLLGIILTGANDDGAAGLAAVHDAGGWTVVQRPDSADTPFMIQAALRQTRVDFVLTLEEIGDMLRTLATEDAA